IIEAVLPAVLDASDLPFAIFGHSMGALLAFELAIALERAGGPVPEHLFVSGRRAPNDVRAGEKIHGLPDDAFLDELDRSFGGVPEIIRREKDLLAMLLPALRADVRTFESYEPLTGDRVRCPVHVYGGADDRHPRPTELHGWQSVADEEISVRILPGDHFFLTTATAALTADIAARWG
ncbi:MAG: hypothetical protein JWM12_3084, partial [Ilumatobacteraceae bacterium]|nr:hypothetical protein [Ilumatobacteraceae bacterium]